MNDLVMMAIIYAFIVLIIVLAACLGKSLHPNNRRDDE